MTKKENVGGLSLSVYEEELIRKLKRPLSFMGEERVRYFHLDGTWVDLDHLHDVFDPSKTVPMLKDRLEEIIRSLSEDSPDRDRAKDLYLEGQSIRRVLHMIKKGERRSDEYQLRKSDIQRWVDYSRRIS
ncbi:MAG: hypothetical protein QCI82_10420 [Candidatus Thermoplasmatota archaeon]|nr:hypothetical protein [Candidatus Thermoplasmatota archaeon]